MSTRYQTPAKFPAHSRVVEIFTPAATSLGTYKLQDINISRPDIEINRPNVDGSPNGWDAVNGQVEGTTAIQIPTSDYTVNKWPYSGCYFEESFGFGANGLADDGSYKERFVILNPGQVFPMTGYWMMNVKIKLDPDKTAQV